MHIVYTVMYISHYLKNWSFLTTKRAIAAMLNVAEPSGPHHRLQNQICFLHLPSNLPSSVPRKTSEKFQSFQSQKKIFDFIIGKCRTDFPRPRFVMPALQLVKKLGFIQKIHEFTLGMLHSTCICLIVYVTKCMSHSVCHIMYVTYSM